MKITYKFATGETSEVEVTDEVGEIIMETRRKEHADNVKAGRHTSIWIDALDYESEELADETTPETLLMDRIDEEMKKSISMKSLTDLHGRRENGCFSKQRGYPMWKLLGSLGAMRVLSDAPSKKQEHFLRKIIKGHPIQTAFCV